MNMPDIWSTEEAEADILDIWDQLHWLRSQKATDLWFLMAHMLGFDWNLELACKFDELRAFVKLICFSDVKMSRCQGQALHDLLRHDDSGSRSSAFCTLIWTWGEGSVDLKMQEESDTKIIWGCFIVSICTFMIRPFLSFSQDWSDRFVKSADFSYCSRQVFEIGWGVNPSEKLEVPIRASNSFLVCFHNFITMQLLRRIAENVDYKAPLLIFGGATRYFENSMQ